MSVITISLTGLTSEKYNIPILYLVTQTAQLIQ